MKTILATIALTLSAYTAQAAFDFDGCFQLYKQNAMYPTICLDGTKEEGINGMGARVVIFGTNTDRIIACGLSSALGGSVDSLEFIQNGRSELILRDVKLESGRLLGKAILGKTELNFFEIDEATSTHLLNNFYEDQRCQGLAPGELKNLR